MRYNADIKPIYEIFISQFKLPYEMPYTKSLKQIYFHIYGLSGYRRFSEDFVCSLAKKIVSFTCENIILDPIDFRSAFVRLGMSP